MADVAVTTPYTAARRLINTADIPTWVNDYDAGRIAAYGLYENIYWTNPSTFKLQQRGNDENPIYIPSGRVVVNTMDRYVGPDWTPIVDPAYGTPAEQGAALLFLSDLWKREGMASMYDSNKLFGIMKGDWAFYITANAAKSQGTRLTVRGLSPEELFPIYDKEDVDRILGYDIVTQYVIGDKTYIKRVRYLKSEHPDHIGGTELPGGPCSYQVDLLEQEGWETDTPKVFQTTEPAVLLPAEITTPPIYHFKNFEEPGNPFGSSEMRGIERLFSAINQSITDEELALALEGLGMYSSSKGQPIDPVTKQPTSWVLGPGRVVHDETFKRVNGVSSVSPFLDHINYLHGQVDEVSGISDVAKGKVDVSVAQSGIALSIRMGPLLTASKRKDRIIENKADQFLYDLRFWAAAYEGINLTNVRFKSTFGDKMPTDSQGQFDILMKMVTADPPLITMAYFRDACRELGYKIPIEVNGQAIADEVAQFQQATDVTGTRLADAMNQPDTTPPADTAAPVA